jgi:DMSO/TMAO reductase YedYZ molybdopterin-dependent catalytic subunit
MTGKRGAAAGARLPDARRDRPAAAARLLRAWRGGRAGVRRLARGGRGVVRRVVREGPPGALRASAFRSPLRGPWLTSVLGLVLLVGLPVMAVTGLLSYAAYDPRLPGNDQTPGAGLLKFYLFSWPDGPAWLYRVNQGVHITLGLALLPVVLAKLWSVLPRLFAWPPARSAAQVLERLSLIMLVGGVLFEFATGIMDIQNWYVFPFSFYTAHLYGAWVFIAGLVVHVALRLRRMLAGLRSRSLRAELGTPVSRTEPEEAGPGDEDSLRPVRPAAPTISRRGLLAAVAGGSAVLAGLAGGQSIGGWARRTALFGPRGLSVGGSLPVNRTAAAIGLTAADVGPAYRLVLAGGQRVSLTREQLAALPQRSARLPIACVEGWSASALWSGVALADLARLAGVREPGGALVQSLERRGSFRQASLSAAQVRDPRSLLALRVNGADLSWDHGYPARTIIPAAPGVHNTKWVSMITFLDAA